MKQFIIICVITSFAVACKTGKCPSLGEKTWVMEKMNGKEIKLRNDIKVYIEFEEKNHRISGYAGCNRFLGSYDKKEYSKLSFSDISATKKSCPDMYVEVMFFKALEITDSYSLRKNRLSLKSNGDVVAVFRAEERPVSN